MKSTESSNTLILIFLIISFTSIECSRLSFTNATAEKQILEKVNSLNLTSKIGKLVYGDQIVRLIHVSTGNFLNSHTQNYGESGSNEQEVTAIRNPTEGTEWMLNFDGNPQDGSEITLTHKLTRKNLHALGKAGQVTKSHRTISAFGQNGIGNSCDRWKIEIAQRNHDNKLRVGTLVKLVNVDVKASLHSGKVVYKPGHNEVSGNKGRSSTCDYWIIDVIWDPYEESKKQETEGNKGDPISNNSTIRLMHIRTRYWLRSNDETYQGTGTQLVNTIIDKPKETIWTIRTNDGEHPAEGSTVRLTHYNTKRNLHMENRPAPLTSTDYQVSAFGTAGEGNKLDYWRLNLVQPRPSEKLTVGCIIRLINKEFDRTLHSYPRRFGGDNQNEVTGYEGRDVYDLWMVDIASPPPVEPTTVTIRGYIRDATNNKLISPLTNAKIVFTINGKNYNAKILPGSIYEVEIPKGTLSRTTHTDGYIDDNDNVSYQESSNEENTSNTIRLSPILNGWRIVLTWDGGITDLDLYVKSLDKNVIIYYMNKSDPTGKMRLDIDVRDGGGPETVTLEGINSGKFSIFVLNYSKNAAFNSTIATVKLYHGDKLHDTIVLNQNITDKNKALWTVCTFDAKTGVVTKINKVS